MCAAERLQIEPQGCRRLTRVAAVDPCHSQPGLLSCIVRGGLNGAILCGNWQQRVEVILFIHAPALTIVCSGLDGKVPRYTDSAQSYVLRLMHEARGGEF